ncbi:MAG: TRAP transporter substrate-binding protein DctP [Sulfurovum sp.]|nr:TRAP transporter substrate-binding protein DctP [Sulfurovum sp.]
MTYTKNSTPLSIHIVECLHKTFKGEIVSIGKKIILLSLAVTTVSVMAGDKVKWKMATTWGDGLVPIITASKNVAKYVEQMSDGKFTIRVDSSNKHKAPMGIFDMVKGGQYQMGHTTSYFWKGKDINLMPLTTMPFGMTAPERMAWVEFGGGQEFADRAHAKYGLLSFSGGNTGNQMGGWFKKEIKSAEDLKGLRMRIPGFAGEVISKLGVAVTNIPPGELYTSLDRGTIDALEWIGPGMDIAMGFHKVAPYYYTGWHEPGAEAQFLVNKKAFEKLNDTNKAILKNAMKLAAYNMYLEFYHMNSEGWAKMKSEYPHIKVRTFSKEIMDKLRAANDELVEKYSKQSPLFKEIIESQRAYMKKSREWTIMSDLDYIQGK